MSTSEQRDDPCLSPLSLQGHGEHRWVNPRSSSAAQATEAMSLSLTLSSGFATKPDLATMVIVLFKL